MGVAAASRHGICGALLLCGNGTKEQGGAKGRGDGEVVEAEGLGEGLGRGEAVLLI